jgi:sugar phosphate isomerase/epimerase
MWDFSWIERRWPGAGFEDWPKALDGLVERGYDAVRIDAFPHLVATDPNKEWTLLPVWSVNDWGSPDLNKVRVQPGLHEFIGLCSERNVKVGLSTWFREDIGKTRDRITSAKVMGDMWNATLSGIEKAGLLNSLLYVDLCNEWPGDIWCPFFRNDPPKLTWGGWYTEKSQKWMREACETVRNRFPGLPVGFSFDLRDLGKLSGQNLGYLDYAEPHLWMSQANDGEFYRLIGYNYDRFSPDSYRALVEKGETLYRSKPAYWHGLLQNHVLDTARALEPHHLPLMTTECWGLVDFKDWPLLNWNWVKDLCRTGVKTAASTGQWLAIGTSNFAAPQFRGMWSDVRWHRDSNEIIKNSVIRPELLQTRLGLRLQG